MTDKKVLIITYYWPPAGGAGVQRWLKFVKYLATMGYQSHVYTTSNPEAPAMDESLLKDIPNNAIIIKKPIKEPFGLYKKLTGKKGNFNAGFLSEEKKSKKGAMESLSMFIRANVFVPDAKMFWIRPSLRFLHEYIQKENIQTIISSGPPHSIHLIALRLKTKLNIKWIADFRDPWTNIDFYKDLPMLSLVDRYQKKLEKKVLNEADRILVVGEQMKHEFQAISPKSKIVVITNGYDTEIKENSSLDEKFSIVHIGSINADRAHESFYQAIAELVEDQNAFKEHLSLKFVGKLDFVAKEYLEKYHLMPFAEIVQYLPYSQIGSLQQSARLLYLPINNTPNAKGILTGKFFEYMAAKRPILAQGPTDGDVAKILGETKAGTIYGFNDISGLKKEILAQFKSYLKNEKYFESEKIEQYSRRNLSLKLKKLIDETEAH
jgi:glycosyltransferase involved in cell wall biosynthesis